jgi:F-type H+-transporting ATPase subunit alpha
MKKVAGTLKLDLAQFRELEAFSQFASDLDASTKAKLDRGAKMMQLLKQNVYAPVVVEKQVCAIYAGAKGFLDNIETSKV